MPLQAVSPINQHYVLMKREFVHAHWLVVILHIVVFISCLIAFFLVDGRELIYAIYIPLDFLLDLGTLVFYLV